MHFRFLTDELGLKIKVKQFGQTAGSVISHWSVESPHRADDAANCQECVLFLQERNEFHLTYSRPERYTHLRVGDVCLSHNCRKYSCGDTQK